MAETCVLLTKCIICLVSHMLPSCQQVCAKLCGTQDVLSAKHAVKAQLHLALLHFAAKTNESQD